MSEEREAASAPSERVDEASNGATSNAGEVQRGRGVRARSSPTKSSPGSRVADAVDAVLEATLVGSFTRLGAMARRRLDDWAPREGRPLAGRVVVISGATSGLGRETARALAALGATIEMIARNAAKAEATCAEIRAETGNHDIGFVTADTGDLIAVQKAAHDLLARHPQIHVLVHNAGALDAVRSTSPEGIEQTVASQLVGPFLLTQLLRPALARAAPSRVLWVSSGGMYGEPLATRDLEMSADGYDGVKAYARTKRAQVTIAEMLADRLRPEGIIVHSMHPGWADTPGVERSLPVFRALVGPLLRTPAEGADTLVWLASDDGEPLATTGRFWLDRRPRAIHKLPSTRASDTPEERARLWAWVVAKSGWAPR